MRRLLALVVGFALVGGCSFALVSGPPANHRQLPAFECTSSRLGPGLDAVWTALHTLNLLAASSMTDQEWADRGIGLERTTAMGVYAGLGALGIAGMYYGFTRTGACRAARAELMERASAAPTGTGTWPPAPAPAPPASAPAPAPILPAPAESLPAPAPVPAPAP